jgi:hypothetical protein
MLVASIVGNGICCHSKNKQINKRLEEARKMGMGMWVKDKDGKWVKI